MPKHLTNELSIDGDLLIQIQNTMNKIESIKTPFLIMPEWDHWRTLQEPSTDTAKVVLTATIFFSKIIGLNLILK